MPLFASKTPVQAPPPYDFTSNDTKEPTIPLSYAVSTLTYRDTASEPQPPGPIIPVAHKPLPEIPSVPGPSSPLPSVVIFSHNGRNCGLPRPSSYDAAVDLVRSNFGAFHLSKPDIRFLARIPWLLPDEDIEITPDSWDMLSPQISKFQVMFNEAQLYQQEWAQQQQQHYYHHQPPSLPMSRTSSVVSKPRPPVIKHLRLKVRFASGGKTVTVLVWSNQTFENLKANIAKTSLKIPAKNQKLALSIPGLSDVYPEDDEVISRYDVKEGDVVLVIRTT